MTNILSKNTIIDGKYSVMFFIKQGRNAESYRVKGIEDRKLYFLKLFDFEQLHQSAFDDKGRLLEIEFSKQIENQNIVTYKDSGEITISGNQYLYLVHNFIAGETLADKTTRQTFTLVYDVKKIVLDVLKGLSYLHKNSIIHNEITPQNILLDESDEENTVAKIIDFGYARRKDNAYNRDELNLQYVASECIKDGAFSEQSDLFSVGVMMYQLAFGITPWNYNTRNFFESLQATPLLRERENPLKIPNISNLLDIDRKYLDILQKATNENLESRFKTADEFIIALDGKSKIEPSNNIQAVSENANKHIAKKGNGFADIAGMQELKMLMQTEVIDVLKNPQEYKDFNLTIPNGMLLYGPPGCGKTFFAERFAEEAGYNFIKVIASDLASIYIHGTQEKIGKIFDEARKSAPCILYFDELDAMARNRDSSEQHYGGEVNEFLSQLDNIGHFNVFVIGSTNKKELIDPAILRSGRLEKHYEITPPDFEARKTMFELYLSKITKKDKDIDYEILANKTNGFVSSDIKLIIDNASRITIREHLGHLSQKTLERVISTTIPSLKKEKERPLIGFVTNSNTETTEKNRKNTEKQDFNNN
jgi:transitional endoplasmic reticulum ATPase